MVLIKIPSNKGGPAARQGFKYQDHVAVSFILKMLRDSSYQQVECETADDIVLVSRQSGETVNEYIQVKTTEGDSKWNQSEATALDNGRADTSLLQKSLLCDCRPGKARFRMVTKRDTAKALSCFKLELEKRNQPDLATSRGTALAKKFKKTRSPMGRDFCYWADNFVWQICGDVDALESVNLRKLAEVIDLQGSWPTHKQQQAIYADFLGWADDAATANVISESTQKVITRVAAMDRLDALLAAADSKNITYSKPYKSKPPPFLVEFHAATEEGLLRSLTGYDVQYDFGEWRHKELAEHLVQWLPEFCLQASEIVNFQVHHAQTILSKAIATFTQNGMERDKLIAELILHVILRNKENSEPIACKVFFASKTGLSEFGNAHIVQRSGEVDQLWLGLARMITVGTMAQTMAQVCSTLDSTINKAALTNEREIIISLREPNHLRSNSEDFNKALERNTPAEEMLKVLCFPVLLAYDSDALSSGYLSDYIDRLKHEINDHYSSLKVHLPKKMDQIRIAVFLVPIESIQNLIKEFNSRCRV
ncbi:dsDNA nuclease domain-containing protein [Pseudomonas hefeiensis]|uniref:DsDNA nuclease domain-containing protein n=1 Tax=Pseudomonas hefeiensis TaxID=2738125 RepID=A0ABY9G5U4_9PSED|nr:MULTISPECIES: dsDNA nuclease domain-containing protein [unclassified Pseudomonas]WLH10906.1 dsDNA nuclease domain-containing protein [Pseudomonas sp. FP205]WLH93986.1 dsDNA nuclease domain-containing protein [Pseudomonas sp. FP53]WLI38260.1 dsDNA nuclease domain-containing protein [Pseudomonas sp. FP821]